MLLGSGELSRELVIALQRLGAEVITVDGVADAPLHGVADRSVVVDMADTDRLTEAIRRLRPTFVVAGAEVTAIGALAAASRTGQIEVVPSVRGARLAADPEGLRRLAADELGLPTVPFWFAGSVDELRSVAEHAGFPMVVKPVAAAAGEGESVMVRAGDIEPAWQRAVAASRVSPVRVLAETVVEVDHEVTLLAVRSGGSADSELDFCAPIGHCSIDGPRGHLVLECWQPQAMSAAATDAAKSIAARAVRMLGGRGLFGVELLVRGDEVYFVDVSLRPYDTALLTLRTQRLSGFELQARAILGLSVDTIMISPGASRLVYSRQAVGEPEAGIPPDAAAVLAEALSIAESDVIMFDPNVSHPRRLGAALATASDVTDARSRAGQVRTALGKLWQS